MIRQPIPAAAITPSKQHDAGLTWQQGQRCLDEASLAQMVEEIAALLSAYLPDSSDVSMRAESACTRSKRYAQMFAFSSEHGGVFSVSAELCCPPPAPGSMSLKCVAAK